MKSRKNILHQRLSGLRRVFDDAKFSLTEKERHTLRSKNGESLLAIYVMIHHYLNNYDAIRWHRSLVSKNSGTKI